MRAGPYVRREARLNEIDNSASRASCEVPGVLMRYAICDIRLRQAG